MTTVCVAAEPPVRHRVDELHLALVDVGEIDHLDAVAGLADRVGVVLIGTDVVPQAARRRDHGDEMRVGRIGDLGEAGPVGKSDDRVLAAGGRDVAPAARGGAHVGPEDVARQPAHQLDPARREGDAVLAPRSARAPAVPDRSAEHRLAVEDLAVAVVRHREGRGESEGGDGERGA
jgi:hypothetical protein